MKWCFFLGTHSPLFGELARQVIREGDECLVLMNGKLKEYDERRYFSEQAKFLSKVDWCKEHWKGGQLEFNQLSWKVLFPDIERFPAFPFRYEYATDIISQISEFFEFVFRQEKPDVIVTVPPTDVFAEIAFLFSKRYRVPFLGFDFPRIDQNRIDVYDAEYTDSRYQQTFMNLSERDIPASEQELLKDLLDKFISHKQVPSYMKGHKIHFNPFEFIQHYLKRIRVVGGPLLEYAKNRKQLKQYDYESELLFWRSLCAPWEVGKRQIRAFLQRRMYSFLDERDNFFLYPLHYQPESSTSVRATYYCDQANTIQNIAFSLPFPYKLYVREHPSAIGSQANSFYKKLRRTPNVVLISPDEDMPRLIQGSSGVITLTGTVGMEAALSGKSAYVLGDVFYTHHPLCRKIKNFEELRKQIRADITNKQERGDLAQINMRFLASYLRNTISGNITAALSGEDTNDYKRMYDDLTVLLREKSE